MNWADRYIEILDEKGKVSFKPKGNSMQPKIYSGDLCILLKVEKSLYRVGDIVLCKVNGRQYLHLISAIKNNRFQISNNKNFVNGWVSHSSIYGLCVQVEDKILLSEQELKERNNGISK